MLDCKNCQHDYWCCKKPAVTLNIDEISRFKEKKLVPLTENKLILGYVYILKKKVNGSCIFFDDKTNLCNIYDKRPITCQKFNCIGKL